MIPYKLHHIWLQGGIPDYYESNWEGWDSALEDWDHIIWTESSLLELCTEEQKKTYSGIQTLINRVNYLKYILMYSEGGVYVDLDTRPLKSLYDFFVQDEIKDIDLESRLSIRYPFNTPRDNKPFGDYDIIIPGRKTMMFYPNGDKPILLDNPVLMSSEGNKFWLELISWAEKRTNLKSGALASTEFLPHEPYGPYGLTDYVFQNYNEPYKRGILILPPTYLLGWNEEPNENMYIKHTADRGW